MLVLVNLALVVGFAFLARAIRTEEGLYLTQLLGWVTVFFGAVLTLRALLDVLRADSARPR